LTGLAFNSKIKASGMILSKPQGLGDWVTTPTVAWIELSCVLECLHNS